MINARQFPAYPAQAVRRAVYRRHPAPDQAGPGRAVASTPLCRRRHARYGRKRAGTGQNAFDLFSSGIKTDAGR